MRRLSASQRAVLAHVAAAPEGEWLLAADIATALGLKPRTMGGRLSALMQRGLLERTVRRRASAWGDTLYQWRVTAAGRRA